MSEPLRLVLVGVGDMGQWWCTNTFPYLAKRGKAKVVAAVDVVPEHLGHAREALGLGEDQCHTDLEQALNAHEADALVIVTPPEHHEAAVDAALAHGLHILSEKPIAGTMEASCRIVRKVGATDRKMCVTMSRRFDRDVKSIEERIHSGDYGRLNYVVQRVTHNWREFGIWGEYRHRMDDPLMVEGIVHHFDVHRALTQSNPATIYAQTWNPAWGEYEGDSTALIVIEMENGTRVQYEAGMASATTLNGWENTYIRAECEGATLELDSPRLRALRNEPAGDIMNWSIDEEQLPLLEGDAWNNELIAEMFCDWVAGRRESHPTEVGDNLQCMAMVFAAIESSRSGGPVDVQSFIRRYLDAEQTVAMSTQTTARES